VAIWEGSPATEEARHEVDRAGAERMKDESGLSGRGGGYTPLGANKVFGYCRKYFMPRCDIRSPSSGELRGYLG
jgi:hypothetical protein